MNLIEQEARKQIGTPYRHHGRDERGLDCVGLVIKVAKDLGLSDFDVTGYPRQAVDESMLGLCREHLAEVSKSDMQPGDVVVMNFHNQRHMGILGTYPLGGLSLIHAFQWKPPQVVEIRLDDKWRARIMAAFRFKEVH